MNKTDDRICPPDNGRFGFLAVEGPCRPHALLGIIGLVLCASACESLDSTAQTVPGAVLSSSQPASKPRVLSPEEMRDTRGGVQTNWVFPDTYWGDGVNQDNVPWQVNYQNISGGTQAFAIFAGNTKVASKSVAYGESGTWTTRTNWPVNGWHLFQTKSSVDGSTWNASWSGQNARVHPSVRTVNIRFWNTTVGGVTTSVTFTQVANYVDALNGWEHNNTDANIDAIYHQCSNFNPTVFQFRLAGLSSTTLSNCTSPIPFGDSNTYPRYGIPSTCTNEAFNDTFTTWGELNILMLPSIKNGYIGFHIRDGSGSCPNTSWYWVGLQASSLVGATGARLIAHELGHWVLYPCASTHSSGTACSGAVNDLMCPAVGATTYRITDAQCDAAAPTTIAYYQDQTL